MELIGQILEYLTYSPRDLLHFSPRAYFRLFAINNEAVWPAQPVLLALGAALAWLAFRVSAPSGRAPELLSKGGPPHPSRRAFGPPQDDAIYLGSQTPRHPEEARSAVSKDERRDRVGRRAMFAILAAAWLFVAQTYLRGQLATIHLAGQHFALAFLAQAALLLAFGVARRGAGMAATGKVRRRGGLAIVVLAVAIYPTIAPLAGRPWAQAEMFGIAPDPTVAATLGVLVASGLSARALAALLPLPLAWCAVTGVTLWTLDAPAFWLMPAIGAAALACVATAGPSTVRPSVRR
ncbi:MAG: hypothetical protein IT562_23560 [Alphaproteobacteria bacterium]|nr:hypothetical protein [Alphaproteobacteria bacterium]